MERGQAVGYNAAVGYSDKEGTEKWKLVQVKWGRERICTCL